MRVYSNDSDPDTIRILITTDNHVGYNEMDPIRGNDAARTFREAMMVAKDQEVVIYIEVERNIHRINANFYFFLGRHDSTRR